MSPISVDCYQSMNTQVQYKGNKMKNDKRYCQTIFIINDNHVKLNIPLSNRPKWYLTDKRISNLYASHFVLQILLTLNKIHFRLFCKIDYEIIFVWIYMHLYDEIRCDRLIELISSTLIEDHNLYLFSESFQIYRYFIGSRLSVTLIDFDHFLS